MHYPTTVLTLLILGAGHADELSYLFKSKFVSEVKPGSLVETIIIRMSRLWTNFAKYADPNPKEKDGFLEIEWKPVAKNELNYLNIDDELTVGVNPDGERIEFWDNLYEEFSYAKYW